MSHPRARPTFERTLRITPATLFERLQHALANQPGNCRGRVFEDMAILRIDDAHRHFWSPALHLHVDTETTGAPILHGRFSPSSPIWTAFIGIYIALLCVLLGASCYGYAQTQLNETPWAFLGVPIALALAGFTYGAAFIGQGLGAGDMYELRSFVDHVIEEN